MSRPNCELAVKGTMGEDHRRIDVLEHAVCELHRDLAAMESRLAPTAEKGRESPGISIGGPRFPFGPPPAPTPFTIRGFKVFEYAAEECRHLHPVDTGHLLIALLREHDGVAAQVLRGFGLKLEAVRDEVLKRMNTDDAVKALESRLAPTAEKGMYVTQSQLASMIEEAVRDWDRLHRPSPESPWIEGRCRYCGSRSVSGVHFTGCRYNEPTEKAPPDTVAEVRRRANARFGTDIEPAQPPPPAEGGGKVSISPGLRATPEELKASCLAPPTGTQLEWDRINREDDTQPRDGGLPEVGYERKFTDADEAGKFLDVLPDGGDGDFMAKFTDGKIVEVMRNDD